jgi:hypothetical protein
MDLEMVQSRKVLNAAIGLDSIKETAIGDKDDVDADCFECDESKNGCQHK